VSTKTSLRLLLFCAVFSLFGSSGTTAWGQTPVAPPATPLTVELASGRRFTAEVDVRTDSHQLWLRWNSPSGYLLRPIDWPRVVRAELDGATYTGRELHEAVMLVRETYPISPPAPGICLVQPLATGVVPAECPHHHGLNGIPPGPMPPPPPFVAAHLFEPPRVRSLAIEARVANWDNDVEVDGILLDIYPLDGAGFVVPVRGTIEVELIGEETNPSRSQQSFAEAGRWTEQVSPIDFQAYGARYRLPFRQVHPEFDLRWAPKGLVHVRLSVPGEGLFEASRSMVRIRPYSALRDQLQQTTGQRFFASERTGQ
jgi:hypothetical protein